MPTFHILTPHVFHGLAALGSAKVLTQTPEHAAAVSAKLRDLEDADSTATGPALVADAVAHFEPLVTGLGNLKTRPPAATSSTDTE